MLEYKDFDLRKPDKQYKNLMRRIIKHGIEVMPQQEYPALMILGHQMRFKLDNGFPIITERDLVSADEGRKPQYYFALAELCAFLNGARTLQEMKKFGCGWWSKWVTQEKCAKRGLEKGDLGPGSYGPAWRNFPTHDGKGFDQIKHVIEQIKELPHLRTHFVSPWIPQYLGRGQGKQQKVVVVPCHGWFHVVINPASRELSLHHIQRSADVPAGLVFNFIQYAALTLMIAQVTGYIAKELVFTISDAHIYAVQIPDVEDMLSTSAERLASVYIDPDIEDFFSFRPEDFIVEDYYPSLPRRVIWTPV